MNMEEEKEEAAAGNKTYANGIMCDISATGILILSIAAHTSG